MIRGFSLTTLVCLLASFASSATAQTKFDYKFADGRKSTSQVFIKTAQTLNLAGNDLVSGSEQALTVTAINGRRAADGTLTVNNRIEAFKSSVTLPGGVELEYDSAKPDAEPPGTQFDFLLDIFKATAKSTWQSVLDRNNRVVAIKGRDAVYADLPPSIRGAMKAQFESEYLVTVANEELAKLPDTPVSAGDSWERINTVRLDSGQRLTFTTRYTYAGSVEQDGKHLEKIDSKTTKVVYSVEGESPLKVLESDLKVAASEGTILFDPDYGQIVSQSSIVHITGPLKLEVQGMELPGQLDLTMESRTTLREVP